jgi:hypothetical protein
MPDADGLGRDPELAGDPGLAHTCGELGGTQPTAWSQSRSRFAAGRRGTIGIPGPHPLTSQATTRPSSLNPTPKSLCNGSTRDEPVHLSDSCPETHQHCSPAAANCCHSLLLDPDATIGNDLRKRLFLLVTGQGEYAQGFPYHGCALPTELGGLGTRAWYMARSGVAPCRWGRGWIRG